MDRLHGAVCAAAVCIKAEKVYPTTLFAYNFNARVRSPCRETPHFSSSCSLSASSWWTRSAGGGASPSGNAAGAATGMTTSERWLTALETRHFSDLTFQEVARALRALSATYVERRDRIRSG